MDTAIERGGSFGRHTREALDFAESEGAAPGTEAGCLVPAESSPLGRRLGFAGTALLLVAGVAFAGHAGYLTAKAHLGQWLLARAFAKIEAGDTRARPWPWADTQPVAKLSVPDHGIELLVLSGASGRTLAWGPAHVAGSALPGRDGHTIVTAHRDTHFAFLGRLAPGTRVLVETPRSPARAYRIERSVIAHHRELRLPAGEGDTLSLVTCYPLDAIDPGTPWRYAVVARAE